MIVLKAKLCKIGDWAGNRKVFICQSGVLDIHISGHGNSFRAPKLLSHPRISTATTTILDTRA
jgi:hypothetical protein